MASAEQLDHAKAFLKKAEEYLASAEDNLSRKNCCTSSTGSK